MSLILEPLKPEDLPAYTQLQWDAFNPLSANMIFPMIYPNGLQPDVLARFHARLSKTFEPDSTSHCFCARDAATNEIVGISWWALHTDTPATKEQIDAKYEEMRKERTKLPVEGENTALNAAFFEAMFYSHYEVMAGQDHYSLNVLGTSPKWQRSGVGSFLLKAGLEEADRRGLPAFLHGGVMGRPLYEKFGFKVIEPMPFNALDYGGRSDGIHWCMVRPAVTSKAKENGEV